MSDSIELDYRNQTAGMTIYLIGIVQTQKGAYVGKVLVRARDRAEAESCALALVTHRDHLNPLHFTANTIGSRSIETPKTTDTINGFQAGEYVKYTIKPTDALIVVDPQNDFLPGGTLAVPDGNHIFKPINRLMPIFDYVVVSRDWHPRNHAYFQANGGPWPWHCLAGTPGAQFSPLLHVEDIDKIVDKGIDPQKDGYSAFAGTDLAQHLRERRIQRIFVTGLATDYCVKSTAIEGAGLGFETIVLIDAIAAINATPGDEKQALDEMYANGVKFVKSTAIVLGNYEKHHP